MKYSGLRPILWTNQLIETIDFYTKILGFAIAEQNETWGWASLYKDEVEIMLAKPNEHIPFDKPIFTGSFYINTDKVDELWGELKDKVEACYEIEEFEWQMREFAIYDNNGYLIQFGQDISEKM
ncbi:VOC family protein [Arcicella aquatica]|uniref:VOC family protein n=1 Tax=Arcicella aquatica TaxID=217141 RepID=A0ABU5QGK0_9BACT|nr:VOC family protein [Arcicella aquatica]MEA5256158.1 VOC family protein [Arcicella aquatica]